MQKLKSKISGKSMQHVNYAGYAHDYVHI